MKKRVFLLLVVLLLLAVLLLVVAVLFCNQDKGETIVREGVGRMEAIWKSLTSKEYYIIQLESPRKGKKNGNKGAIRSVFTKRKNCWT